MPLLTPVSFARSWSKTPSVVVVASTPSDARAGLVADAVAFWNQQLADLASSFRLGAVMESQGSAPESRLRELSQATLNQSVTPGQATELTKAYDGDIVVFLARGSFVSFASGYVGRGQMLVAIRGLNTFPCNLPNVCRNVIAHEMGHAIGLLHNSDPAMLMCGRPATCTPDVFASPTAHYFPLTEPEKTRLLQLYPRDWAPH